MPAQENQIQPGLAQQASLSSLVTNSYGTQSLNQNMQQTQNSNYSLNTNAYNLNGK